MSVGIPFLILVRNTNGKLPCADKHFRGTVRAQVKEKDSSHPTCQVTIDRCKKKNLAALSMLHKAKKAYYACDVIRFLVP